MTSNSITCINGQFLTADAAKLPITDRGFRFGDGVFETVCVHSGVGYQWPLHLDRLEKGLKALRITPPAVDWRDVARQLLTKNQSNQGFIRISVSRGVGSRGYMPLPEIIPNWVMEYLPPSPPLDGACVLWRSTITRPPLSALPVNHKLAQGVGSTLALMEARDHNADEALLLTHDGFLSEAASANLFWMIGSEIYTPSLKTGCLAGTTRMAVMRLASKPVHEVIATPDKLERADAAFLTSARVGIWPVERVIDMETSFDIGHTPLVKLQKALIKDQEAHVETHRAEWLAA